MSKPYSLNAQDWLKGLAVAILAALVAKLAEAMNVPGFDFVAYDWHSLVSVAITAGIAYLAKNFTQDANGTPFGKAH